MSQKSDRVRVSIQKLTEAIWNLEQLDSMSSEIKEEYATIIRVREHLVTMLKNLKEV